jgi:hypothetical protein
MVAKHIILSTCLLFSSLMATDRVKNGHSKKNRAKKTNVPMAFIGLLASLGFEKPYHTANLIRDLLSFDKQEFYKFLTNFYSFPFALPDRLVEFDRIHLFGGMDLSGCATKCRAPGDAVGNTVVLRLSSGEILHEIIAVGIFTVILRPFITTITRVETSYANIREELYEFLQRVQVRDEVQVEALSHAVAESVLG